LVVSHLFSLFLSGCFLVFLYYTGVDKKLPGSFFGLKYLLTDQSYFFSFGFNVGPIFIPRLSSCPGDR
jgi:hypothetical protein